MIPEAAVEAAARAMSKNGGGIIAWRLFADEARLALEAAMPHMLAESLAEAWDEGHDGAADEMAKYENPYRTETSRSQP